MVSQDNDTRFFCCRTDWRFGRVVLLFLVCLDLRRDAAGLRYDHCRRFNSGKQGRQLVESCHMVARDPGIDTYCIGLGAAD